MHTDGQGSMLKDLSESVSIKTEGPLVGFGRDSLMLIVGRYILIGALTEVDYSFVDCPFSLRRS